MQPFDKASRLDRINRASQEFKEVEKFTRANPAPVGEHDPEIFTKLAPGICFVSACEIRVVPKVQPRPGAQMKAAIMQSRVFIPGVLFKIVGQAMTKRGKRWWRVQVILNGEPAFTGFILEPAIKGHLSTKKQVA